MKMKPKSDALAKQMVQDAVRRILKGDGFRKAVAERKKLPKRFSGKTGILFLPEYQELADKPIR